MKRATLAAACALLLTRQPVFALNPALDVSQYAHTAWKIRDGLAKGYVQSIAQTPDGYLWLATEFGLLRFDGVRSVPWQPPAGQSLPSTVIFSVLTARDGSLWIATDKGLARWKDGVLTQVTELAGQFVLCLLETRDGSVWAGTIALDDAKICAIGPSGVHCYGGKGRFGSVVLRLHEDSRGNLWVGVSEGLWRWQPGTPEYHPLPGERDSIRSFVEDDGLLFGTAHGLRRVVNGNTEAYAIPGTARELNVHLLLRDRDGGLWIGTLGQGLVHVHQGRTDVFTRSEGLSGDTLVSLFEDREGSIWVATRDGLDRFRDVAVPTFGASQGVSNATSVLAATGGSLWFGSKGVLNHRTSAQWTTRTADSGKDAKAIAIPNSLLQDRLGRIWFSSLDGIGYLENDRPIWLLRAPGGSTVHAMGDDLQGNIWAANQSEGLFRVSRDGTTQRLPWGTFARHDFGTALVADPADGGMWVGFHNGGIAHLTDGQVRAVYGAANGLGDGRVNTLRFDRHGALWAATAGGLSRLHSGRIATLTRRNGLPCDGVHWDIEDEVQSVWLYLPCGLVRIPAAELDAWSASVDDAGDGTRMVQATLFDSSDGVLSLASPVSYTPQVARSADGRIWFTSIDGISVVDPRHLPFNNLPPPVQVERITADRQTYEVSSGASGNLQLPPLTRDLQIDYTALSLAVPEKVRFRYKLEGRDHEWQDVGNRRQAFYTNLPPRNYRFLLTASNNSGVWSEDEASLAFAVLPAYYQTISFRVTVAAGMVLTFVALYQLHLRQVARRFNMQLEARVEERTRIARELHDTLLQSFQGVLLKFKASTYLLPDRPDAARTTLESVIDEASLAIAEGRDTVHGLRTSTLPGADIGTAIGLLGERLAAEHGGSKTPALRVGIEGMPRDLAPIVRDEVYRIAGEAMRNAFRHAEALHVEVDVHFDPRLFRVRVRDDGKGMDPAVQVAGGRDRHFGLAGMHERAELVGGKLAVWSQRHAGSEIELTIPASVAYAKPSALRRSAGSGQTT